MFDLTKLEDSLKAGTDRVCRILGKKNLDKVRKDAWKSFAEKNKGKDSGDSTPELRSPEG